jgi:hypothetical protein
MMTALIIAGGLCLLLCIGIRGRMIAEETERAEVAEGEAYLARLASKLEAGGQEQAAAFDWVWVGTDNDHPGPHGVKAFAAPAGVKDYPEPRGVNVYPDEDLPSVARGAGILGPEDLR